MIRILLIVCLCLLGIEASLLSSKDDHEPVCSKYHYEVQILEKLVRMEHSNALMMEEFKDIREKVSEDLAGIKIEFENVKVSLTEEKNKLQDDRDNLERWLTKEKEKMTKMTEDEIQRYTEARNELQQSRSTYAFAAYWLSDTSLGSGDTLIFTKTMFDEEQTYNNSTGKYTVPVSGLYLFTAEICTSVNQEAYINFVTDGTRFGAFHVGDKVWNVCSQGTAIGSLHKGSKVWLKATDSGTIYNRDSPLGFNYFAGYSINEIR